MVIARHFDARWHQCIHQSIAYLYDRLIRKPWNGLKDVVHGLAVAVPVLFEGLKESIVSHLSPADRAQLSEGLDQLWQGWVQIRWLLVAVVLVAKLGWCGVIVCVAGTVIVASI